MGSWWPCWSWLVHSSSATRTTAIPPSTRACSRPRPSRPTTTQRSAPFLRCLFFQNGAKHRDLRCVLCPAPSGAGFKTRLESRIKGFKIPCVVDAVCLRFPGLTRREGIEGPRTNQVKAESVYYSSMDNEVHRRLMLASVGATGAGGLTPEADQYSKSQIKQRRFRVFKIAPTIMI